MGRVFQSVGTFSLEKVCCAEWCCYQGKPHHTNFTVSWVMKRPHQMLTWRTSWMRQTPLHSSGVNIKSAYFLFFNFGTFGV